MQTAFTNPPTKGKKTKMNNSIKNAAAALRAEYPFRVELHAHTSPASSCSEIPPAKLPEIYAGLGYSAVCVTNHLARGRGDNAEEWLTDYYAAKESGDRLGINVILGVELRFIPSNNDYLLYGITPEDISEIVNMLDMNIEEFSRAYRAPNRFLCQAHPYRSGMDPTDHTLFDGIEVFNAHPNHNSRVAVASQIAHREGLIFTAGTDFHHPGHEGLAAIRTRTVPKTSADVAALLKSADFLLEVGESLILP